MGEADWNNSVGCARLTYIMHTVIIYYTLVVDQYIVIYHLMFGSIRAD